MLLKEPVESMFFEKYCCLTVDSLNEFYDWIEIDDWKKMDQEVVHLFMGSTPKNKVKLEKLGEKIMGFGNFCWAKCFVVG